MTESREVGQLRLDKAKLVSKVQDLEEDKAELEEELDKQLTRNALAASEQAVALGRRLETAGTTAELARKGQRQAEAKADLLVRRVEELEERTKDRAGEIASLIHQETDRLHARIKELEGQLKDRDDEASSGPPDQDEGQGSPRW